MFCVASVSSSRPPSPGGEEPLITGPTVLQVGLGTGEQPLITGPTVLQVGVGVVRNQGYQVHLFSR